MRQQHTSIRIQQFGRSSQKNKLFYGTGRSIGPGTDHLINRPSKQVITYAATQHAYGQPVTKDGHLTNDYFNKEISKVNWNLK